MPERFARFAALALLLVLLIALVLLISLFGAMNSPRAPATQIAIASPTRVQPTNTVPPPSATTEPTPLPPPTAIPSPSPTAGCPSPATPEPLWVNPVLSPTNLLTQKISVTLGRGRELGVTTEAGTVTRQGEFSVARPVEIEIPLVANSENHLLVRGRVEYAANCFYTLETRLDRVGNPLVIVQTSAQVPTPPTIAPITAPPGSVFLKPFAQVFALNQDAPNPNDKLWLYTAPDPNSPFQILAQEGAFTHLLSQGGTLHFWTLNENVITAPAPFPQYDNTVAGRTVEFVSETIFACEAQYPRPLILGVCGEISALNGGEILQRVQVEGAVLYEVRVNNKIYWVSANVLKEEPR